MTLSAARVRGRIGPKDIADPSIPTKRDAIRALSAIGSCVYAVQVQGVVKIGHTSNLDQRLQSLGSHHLLGIIPGATREDEADLHRRLAGHALRGREWYPIDDPAVLEVIDRMRDSIGVGALR